MQIAALPKPDALPPKDLAITPTEQAVGEAIAPPKPPQPMHSFTMGVAHDLSLGVFAFNRGRPDEVQLTSTLESAEAVANAILQTVRQVRQQRAARGRLILPAGFTR